MSSSTEFDSLNSVKYLPSRLSEPRDNFVEPVVQEANRQPVSSTLGSEVKFLNSQKFSRMLGPLSPF